MEQKKLNAIIEKHALWLSDKEGGECANLIDANLIDANLSGAYLRGADLSDASLRGANLIDAYLRGANLSDASLRGANLIDASLRGANLIDANLRGANLSGANLIDANLSGAYLRGANGNLHEIKNLSLEMYPITYTAEILQIGCERHPIADWFDFDDRRILEMDGKQALKFWQKFKELIRQTIELSPAVPTNYEEKPEEVSQ